MAKKKKAPQQANNLVSESYQFNESALDEKLSSVFSDDATFRIVDVHFWGKNAGKATLIVTSKLDLDHIQNTAVECKDHKNPKPGAMLPVYQYGTKTQDQIEALPKERVPENVLSLITNNKKRKKKEAVEEPNDEGE